MLWRSRRGRRYPPRATVLHDPTAAITPQRRDSHGLVAARAAMARRDLAAAEAALLTHLRAHPHDADALVECAEFSFRSGRPDRACWALAKALALFPGSARWHGQLGYANLAVGDHDAARESFERALTLAPDDPAANYGLASCCQRERRWPAAAAALERALAPAGAGDAFAIVLELIGVLCQAGAFDAARRHCEQAARLAPAEPALWYATARLELAGGRPALALAAIERCLRATPDELPPVKYLSVQQLSGDDLKTLAPRLRSFAEQFDLDADEILAAPFTRLAPTSHRPFAAKYAPA